MNCSWIIGLLMVCAPGLAAAQQSVTPSSPTQTTHEGVLQDGLPIKLQLMNKLDSHSAKVGDRIEFEVINDVVVNGVIVLRRGAPATGVITASQASKTMGRAGRLTFTIDEIRLSNGEKVPVRAYNRSGGENRTGEMVYLMLNTPMAAAPFFLLMHWNKHSFHPRYPDRSLCERRYTHPNGQFGKCAVRTVQPTTGILIASSTAPRADLVSAAQDLVLPGFGRTLLYAQTEGEQMFHAWGAAVTRHKP